MTFNAAVKLKFGKRNYKLNALADFLGYRHNSVLTFDLPAGFSCPKAGICRAFSNRETGKMTRSGRVKCYAAHQEAYLPAVRACRWHNFESILSCGKNIEKIAALIQESLPISTKIVRIHSSGDFFSKEYFQAWVRVAVRNPEIQFFGYSKVLDCVLANKPDNFNLVYSYGSKDDMRRDDMQLNGFIVPTCYIQEYPTQFTELMIPVVCASKGDEHEDYGHILSGLSFIIKLH